MCFEQTTKNYIITFTAAFHRIFPFYGSYRAHNKTYTKRLRLDEDGK